MNKTSGIIFVLIVLIAGWYLVAQTPDDVMEENTDTTMGMPAGDSTVPEMTVLANPSVTYSNEGYAPQNITIVEGETVTWVNESSKDMWVASAMHPTHILYSGTPLKEHCDDAIDTSFDACKTLAPGESYSFTFDKVGEWKYHDHIDASKWGSVTVLPNTGAN